MLAKYRAPRKSHSRSPDKVFRANLTDGTTLLFEIDQLMDMYLNRIETLIAGAVRIVRVDRFFVIIHNQCQFLYCLKTTEECMPIDRYKRSLMDHPIVYQCYYCDQDIDSNDLNEGEPIRYDGIPACQTCRHKFQAEDEYSYQDTTITKQDLLNEIAGEDVYNEDKDST